MSVEPKKRPLSIVLLLGFELISLVFAAPQALFSPAVRAAGLAFQIWLAVDFFLVLACMWGYFQMKRLGVVGYAALTIINQLILARMRSWDWHTLVLPSIVLAVGLANWKDMD